ncbi:MAG: hypothetical protein HWE20_13735 [Gammaproteobacteria bacterium]|nr:hypothetical protein [Gammaproteobacteria bacterium]
MNSDRFTEQTKHQATTMQARYMSLLSGCSSTSEAVKSRCFAVLDSLYSAPSRQFHNWQHIESLFEYFDRFSFVIKAPQAVSLAIFYHDAIYDERADDNEARSASLYAEHALLLGIPAVISKEVVILIDATRHIAAQTHTDAAVMADLDLMPLAVRSDVFRQNSTKVRKEFSSLSDKEFSRRQFKFMSALLDRSSIYQTPVIRDAMEAGARQNVVDYLKSLQPEL